MRLAATHGDAWVTTGDRTAAEPLAAAEGAAVVRDQLARLEEACAAVDRAATIDRLVLTGPGLAPGLSSVEEFRDTVGRYEEIGVTDLVVHWPRPDPPYAGDQATFERVITA
jgi:hypothetical protein